MMKTKLITVISFALLTSACATTGHVEEKSFEQQYSEKTASMKTCVENTIVAVLGVAFKGPEVFSNLCEERH